MKILEFIAENYKKLRVVEIQPGQKHMVQITGANGAGKSTVLDAIWFALKGQKALPAKKASVVRHGSERLKVQLKLANGDNQAFSITRTLGKDGNPPTLTIQPGVHKQAGKTPQEFLDDLFGALTFDPLAFAHMDTADQIAELKKTAKVDIDFDEIAAANLKDYKEREGLLREAQVLKRQYEGMQVVEGLPKEKVDEAAIVAQLNEASEKNQKAQEFFAAKQKLGLETARLVGEEQRKLDEIEQQRHRVAQLKKDLEAAETKLSDLRTEAEDLQHKKELARHDWEAAPAGELVDVGRLTQELQSAQRTNRAIDQRAEYNKVKAEHDEKKKKYDTLTRRMDAREEQKKAALAKAKIPVPGLTFDETEVKYNGVPLELLGEGEQIRISTLIGMAANPKLRILCIRHGEALDDAGVKAITDLAKQNDFQVWMARVDTSGKVGIVLEDGSIAATNEEE